MKVRLVCRLKMRVPKKAIPGPSTWLSSITSPVLMSRAPRKTVSGFFIWLPEPRSSPAPHFDGQRWLSGGTFHCAAATNGTASKAAAMRFIVFPLVDGFVKAFVGGAVAQPLEPVAEFPGGGGRGVRLVGLLVLPGREEDELARPGRVLHRLRAQISLFPAGSVAVALEERRGFRLRRRLHLHIGHHVKRRWTLSEHFEGSQ